ncbi:MAG: FtsX-like permease family protein [Phycisphaerae bacterium]|nr:FtsX-like permease family protein [Phycisphaerae bacterium]
MRLLPFEYATRNLGRSPMRLALTVFGSGLVVLLIMIAGSFMVGMQATLAVSGAEQNIMLLGAGSVESVERSEVGMDTAGIVAGSIDGFRNRAGIEGVSPEIHIQMPLQVDGEDRLILIRGVRPEAFLVHDQVQITNGNAPRSGRNEMVVGKLAALTLGYNNASDAIGAEIMLDDDAYTVSGIFSADGGIVEGEMWTSLTDLQITSQRDTLSCVIVALDSAKPSDLDMFAASRIDLELAAISEDEYFSALANFYKPIEMMVVITCIMIAIGGMLGGFNSTYAAFASRVREVGTLQTLGYQRGAIAWSLVQESVLSASVGAIIACIIALFALDGFSVRFSMGTFTLSMTSGVIALGVGSGLLLGIIGAIAPALRCLRLPIPEALRASE